MIDDRFAAVVILSSLALVVGIVVLACWIVRRSADPMMPWKDALAEVLALDVPRKGEDD